MRRIVVFDPTAGERARRANEFPEEPQPILDPTDPRYGLADRVAGRRADRDGSRRRDDRSRRGHLAG